MNWLTKTSVEVRTCNQECRAVGRTGSLVTRLCPDRNCFRASAIGRPIPCACETHASGQFICFSGPRPKPECGLGAGRRGGSEPWIPKTQVCDPDTTTEVCRQECCRLIETQCKTSVPKLCDTNTLAGNLRLCGHLIGRFCFGDRSLDGGHGGFLPLVPVFIEGIMRTILKIYLNTRFDIYQGAGETVRDDDPISFRNSTPNGR